MRSASAPADIERGAPTPTETQSFEPLLDAGALRTGFEQVCPQPAGTIPRCLEPGDAGASHGDARTPKPAIARDETPGDEPVNLDPEGLTLQVKEEAAGSADELYRRARAWFSSAFDNADAVLDLEDPVGHHLSGKALAKFSQSSIGGADTTAGGIR